MLINKPRMVKIHFYLNDSSLEILQNATSEPTLILPWHTYQGDRQHQSKWYYVWSLWKWKVFSWRRYGDLKRASKKAFTSQLNSVETINSHEEQSELKSQILPLREDNNTKNHIINTLHEEWETPLDKQ